MAQIHSSLVMYLLLAAIFTLCVLSILWHSHVLLAMKREFKRRREVNLAAGGSDDE